MKNLDYFYSFIKVLILKLFQPSTVMFKKVVDKVELLMMKLSKHAEEVIIS
jgi:hypothetical protein